MVFACLLAVGLQLAARGVPIPGRGVRGMSVVVFQQSPYPQVATLGTLRRSPLNAVVPDHFTLRGERCAHPRDPAQSVRSNRQRFLTICERAPCVAAFREGRALIRQKGLEHAFHRVVDERPRANQTLPAETSGSEALAPDSAAPAPTENPAPVQPAAVGTP